MEITKVKVEVKTLNKTIFNQLEYTPSNFRLDDNDVIGWVNVDKVKVLVLLNNNKLYKMSWQATYDAISFRETTQGMNYGDFIKYFEKYYNKFEQIFI